jgi:predicted RNase H-like nuclease (RuvC/YqgF family)
MSATTNTSQCPICHQDLSVPNGQCSMHVQLGEPVIPEPLRGMTPEQAPWFHPVRGCQHQSSECRACETNRMIRASAELRTEVERLTRKNEQLRAAIEELDRSAQSIRAETIRECAYLCDQYRLSYVACDDLSLAGRELRDRILALLPEGGRGK